MRHSPAVPSANNTAVRRPRAKKSLGQHFLHNNDICARIVALLKPETEDRILEIGPGRGALTRLLETRPHRQLLLVEKDSRCLAECRCSERARTMPVLMDALHFDWRRIHIGYPWKIIGNLPYNIASRLVWNIVSQSTGLIRAVFMVQNEVGQRMAAQPGSRHYGALSVWVQAFVRADAAFKVGCGAFTPPPRVESVVLSLEPLPIAERPAYPRTLARLLHLCFQQRRKQLAAIFRQAGLSAMTAPLNTLGIAPTQRPESLSTTDFQRLSEAARAMGLLKGEKTAVAVPCKDWKMPLKDAAAP